MSASTSDGERDRQAFRFFCRHLVALGASYWIGPHGAEDRPQLTVYSGTLINVRGVVFYLTAGHALQNLRDAMLHPQFTRDSFCLIDTFGPDAQSNHPIPFALESDELLFIDDEAHGLDFGMIRLRPYYVNLLSKNGMVALEDEQWVHQHRVQFDFYTMLGVPEEFTRKELSSTGYASVQPVMLPVEFIPPEPVPADGSRYERFRGRIGHGIQSPKGMSGGPILGFNDGENLRYWVVAIQSSWDPASRTVFGCPVPTLASLITGYLDYVTALDIHTPDVDAKKAGV